MWRLHFAVPGNHFLLTVALGWELIHTADSRFCQDLPDLIPPQTHTFSARNQTSLFSLLLHPIYLLLLLLCQSSALHFSPQLRAVDWIAFVRPIYFHLPPLHLCNAPPISLCPLSLCLLIYPILTPPFLSLPNVSKLKEENSREEIAQHRTSASSIKMTEQREKKKIKNLFIYICFIDSN